MICALRNCHAESLHDLCVVRCRKEPFSGSLLPGHNLFIVPGVMMRRTGRWGGGGRNKSHICKTQRSFSTPTQSLGPACDLNNLGGEERAFDAWRGVGKL